MAVKYICDVCRSEDMVSHCGNAQADLCEKCHVKFHDDFREFHDQIVNDYETKRDDVLNNMRKCSKGVVTPLNC